MKSIMRWGKAALSKVEEVVAPLNSLPPEKAFERSWSSVVDFYHNVAASDDGDPLSAEGTLGRSNLMEHLDRMVQLLREEEKMCEAMMAEGDVGPCMTVLLQKKIVDNLCALGQADRPPGMMPLVLDTMQQLLEGSRQGLMDHHHQITEPVNKLIQSAALVEGSANKIRLLHLVQTMFKKIRHKPELMEYLVKRDDQGELSEFFMFSTLVNHINDPDEAGVHARRGALTGITVAEKHPALLRFIAHTTTFCSDVAIGIANAYSAVLQLGEHRFGEAEKHGAADYLRDQITFLRALGQCEPEQAVALTLTRELDMVFIEPILQKSFTESTNESIPFALDLCRALITQLGPSSLRTRIVNQLIGGPGHATSETPLAIRRLWMEWAQGEDVCAQQGVLQLLAGILSTRDESVLGPLLECGADAEVGPVRECTGELQQLLGEHLELGGRPDLIEKQLKDYREEAEAQLYLWEPYQPLGPQENSSQVECQETFIGQMLAQLRQLLNMDLNVAVVLTGLVSLLVQCPDPRVHSFMFRGGEHAPLTAAVMEVCSSVKSLMEETPESHAILDRARKALDSEEKPAQASNEELETEVAAQFRNLVVWEEFVKELLATIEMKNMLFAIQLDQD